MTEYIKREDALRAFNGSCSTVDADDILRHLHKSIDVIKNIPSADVRENVKGRWVEYPDCLKYAGAIMQEDFVCPECKAVFSAIDNEGERFNFCPNCGADMRGEV